MIRRTLKEGIISLDLQTAVFSAFQGDLNPKKFEISLTGKHSSLDTSQAISLDQALQIIRDADEQKDILLQVIRQTLALPIEVVTSNNSLVRHLRARRILTAAIVHDCYIQQKPKQEAPSDEIARNWYSKETQSMPSESLQKIFEESQYPALLEENLRRLIND